MIEYDHDVLSNIKSLPPVEPRLGLAEVVHHALRDAITKGDLVPGTRLPEVRLARQFGVSPTPVREAIRSLEREGLVKVSRHHGASVVSATPTEIASLYEMHEVLESYAMGRAAAFAGTNRTVAGRHVLADAEASLSEIDAVVDDANQAAFNRLDLVFHRALNALSGNAMLVTTIEQIHCRIQAARINYDVYLPNRPRQSQAQHRDLLEAVQAGNVARAQTVARTHIRSIRDPVLDLLQRTDETEEPREEG